MDKYTREPKTFKELSPPHLVKDRWAYIDKVQVWLAAALPADKIQPLKGLCEFIHIHGKTMGYRPHWKQRLQLNQPTDAAFSYLAELTHARHLINSIEFALDLIVEDDHDAETLKQFFQMHLVQPWHGKQRVTRVRTMTYWGKRWSRNQLVLYSDRHSKATGEVHCCHLEWRIRGASAVRAIGINNLNDLIDFDHHVFWKKHLNLWTVDFGNLGRAYIRTRRRKPHFVEYRQGPPFDMDAKIGNTIARLSQQAGDDGQPVLPPGSVQDIIDRSRERKNVNISRALIRLPSDLLLPR